MRTSWHRLVATLTAAVAVSACGGGDQAVPAGTAERLAAAAEKVATLIESDEACAAIDEAEALAASARRASDAGELPEPTGDRIVSTAAGIADDLHCVRGTDAAQEESDGDVEGRDGDSAKGEGKAKGKGNDEGRGDGEGRGNGDGDDDEDDD